MRSLFDLEVPAYFNSYANQFSDASIDPPSNCLKIMNDLVSAGYEAYVVGGCIRDTLLGREPNDWDIATSAKPEEMKQALSSYRYYDTGIEHGTVTFIVDDESYEVTTFRVDGQYSDGRHPESVTFVSNIEQDLSRRDFTINAMAWNPQQGLIDPYDGFSDLKRQVIRCVGEPRTRFKEDHLRILRALRFSATLDFTLDYDTAKATSCLAAEILNVSKERIASELFKMFSASNSAQLAYVIEHNLFVMTFAFGKLVFYYMKDYDQHSKYHDRDLLHHSLDVMQLMPKDPELRIAALFHDIGKIYVKTEDDEGYWHYTHHPEKSEEIVRSMLKNLKCSNEIIEHICFLVLNHDARPSATKRSARKFIMRCNNDENRMRELLSLMYADIACHTLDSAHQMRYELDEAVKVIDDVLNDENCFSLKDLKINGNDLKELGFEQGPEIGRCLNMLLESVLNDEVQNETSELKAKALQIS